MENVHNIVPQVTLMTALGLEADEMKAIMKTCERQFTPQSCHP